MAEFQYLDGGNSEVQDMQAEAYLYAPSGTVGIAATGVIEGLLVTQTGTASGSVLIGAGACINQASLDQGASRLINPSQKTLDIFTANPVGGLPRNDVVVFDSVTKLILVIVGTPNATPTDPTVSATSVALARLRHAASATTIPTAKIDTLIVSTTLRGIPAPVVDSGWQALTLNSGGVAGSWGAVTGYPMQVRKIDNRVWVRGMAAWGAIGGGSLAVMTTLPSGFRPAANTWLQMTIGHNTACLMQPSVSTAGVIGIATGYYIGSLGASAYVSFTGTFLND